MAEQYAPIGTKTMNQMRPIEFLCAALKNMRDIGAVESNHFLRCAKFHMQAKQFSILRALKPGIVDLA